MEPAPVKVVYTASNLTISEAGEVESRGYFTIAGLSAKFWSNSPPIFSRGDRVKITITKEPPTDASTQQPPTNLPRT